MGKINLELKISREELRNKLNIKDGAPGKRGEKGEPGESTVGLPGPKGEDGSPDTPEQVRDKLENLDKGTKLTIHAIEDLAEILEELRKPPKGGLGLLKGSVHAGKGREIRFIDDEVPVNSGDDTNFTISKTPLAGSLKFYRNGSRQVLTTDYTLSGKTITLVVSLQDPSEKLLVDYRY